VCQPMHTACLVLPSSAVAAAHALPHIEPAPCESQHPLPQPRATHAPLVQVAGCHLPGRGLL
jgi:hypothetical protein